LAPPTIGILALQGGYAAHAKMFAEVGAQTREVRVPGDLQGLDALVIPGGESTTMTLGIEREALAEPLTRFAATHPVLGSCAGLIMLDSEHLALMDITAQRNAFGRQIHSFEAPLQVAGLSGGPLRAIFIRAPWIERAGSGVEVLAELDGHPVAAREGNIWAVAFHPELGQDTRLHELFAAAASGRGQADS
jgi:5'-phosphate synthase pdxT subunit